MEPSPQRGWSAGRRATRWPAGPHPAPRRLSGHLAAASASLRAGSKGYGDPYTFDNVYYKELLKKPWLNPNDNMASMIGLPSDHVLPDDPELNPIIQVSCAPGRALAFLRQTREARSCSGSRASLACAGLGRGETRRQAARATRRYVSVLRASAPCLTLLQEYAKDQSAFHRDFAAAYLRLSELGA